MIKINENYLKLKKNYLFSDMAKKVSAFKEQNPGVDIISLGIGDVTMPLAKSVVEAMKSAVAEMSEKETFKGYPPEHGYDFLVDKIIKYDFEARGVRLDKDEIFVSDGAKSDTANIGDILSEDNKVAICDPVYPVYFDTNTMAGRNVDFLPCNAENGFVAEVPDKAYDLIYLCFPNNPTGSTATYDELKKWVDYAIKNNALILFDAAYEAFIRGDFPHSIYEIEGAEKCAIEFRSYSKTAGFTGVRCSYTVVPKALKVDGVCLNDLWTRRQGTKFNGVSYIIQRGAEAIYSDEGMNEVKETIDYYLENARLIKEALTNMGYTVFGGENAPYIWLKVKDNMTSWEFFDYLLKTANIVGTPGSGFGSCGEGYFRLTAFGSREDTLRAIERLKNL